MPEELPTTETNTAEGANPLPSAQGAPAGQPEDVTAGPVEEAESLPDAQADGNGAVPAEAAPDAEAEEGGAPEGDEAPKPTGNKHWYVVKVQSGREESIKEAIERRVKIEGVEDLFGQIIIPTEKVTQMRNNKRVVREQKLYPGYLMCQVEYNDRILYLFRETSGVGDFVGGGLNHPPAPMSEREVERMLGQQNQLQPGIKPTRPKYDVGDRVKVKDGTFAGMEGEVKDFLEAKGLVRVELTIFGRPVPVELEYWQVDHE